MLTLPGARYLALRKKLLTIPGARCPRAAREKLLIPGGGRSGPWARAKMLLLPTVVTTFLGPRVKNCKFPEPAVLGLRATNAANSHGGEDCFPPAAREKLLTIPGARFPRAAREKLLIPGGRWYFPTTPPRAADICNRVVDSWRWKHLVGD